eukprot:TRINITY_DN5222_c0_g1_i12.p2 TRINITY_DN5222_c0_g1~~TRINITY_DN5222_c0_g1_i12.p2  ORF type:complete len:133 (+),score=45.00 TRINITY_DN5222_c0_g1_i12:370-768(+)
MHLPVAYEVFVVCVLAAIFTNRGDAEKANEPHVLSLEEILRRKKLKQQQEQHEDTATKRVAPVPARRSKAEVQICVPPPRKNAGVSSVKAANVSPPRHTSVVKKRLGEPSAVGMKSFSQMMDLQSDHGGEEE